MLMVLLLLLLLCVFFFSHSSLFISIRFILSCVSARAHAHVWSYVCMYLFIFFVRAYAYSKNQIRAHAIVQQLHYIDHDIFCVLLVSIFLSINFLFSSSSKRIVFSSLYCWRFFFCLIQFSVVVVSIVHIHTNAHTNNNRFVAYSISSMTCTNSRFCVLYLQRSHAHMYLKKSSYILLDSLTFPTHFDAISVA